MTIPKLKIGDTVVIYKRWFLWFKDYVLCVIVGGYYSQELKEWRYILKQGNGWIRFIQSEYELLNRHALPND